MDCWTSTESSAIPPLAVARTGARTLLLVDDEENILSALRRLLRRGGYRILTSGSGEEALRLLATESVDVIISDQQMPTMTGVEFLRRAKESCPTAIRMVLSGYTELQSITDAINEGSISKFLTKPWDDDQLLAHVREALATKDLADECLRLQRELQRANAALAQSNAQLHALLGRKQADLEREEISLNVTREILEHMPLPVIGIDMDGMVAMANTAAEALFAAGASIMGAPACMVLPSTMLAMCEDERCATASFEQQGRRYTVLGRVMGERSESRGHLLFVMPGTP